MDSDAVRLRRIHGEAAQLRAVRLGAGNVRDVGAVVKRIRAARRAVYELVGDDEMARRDVRLQRADGVGRDNARDAQTLERPQIGLVGDFVRRQGVGLAVPGQEGDPAAGDGRQARSCRSAGRRASRP